MADWEHLREIGTEAAPPPFESLEAEAGRRNRRARVVAVTAALAVVTTLGFGVSMQDDDRDADIQPGEDPTPSVTTSLPEGVLSLPEHDPGSNFATLAAGRYRVPLDDTLAFEIDLPDDTAAHSEGLFLATENFIVKAEIAGEDYGVPRDPCTGGIVDTVGPTVDDLVEAVSDLPVYRLTDPEDVELGGAEGVYIEARVPRSYDASLCTDGSVRLPGNSASAVSGPPPYLGRWWILDVEGRRVVVQQNCWGCDPRRFDRGSRTPESITFTLTS